MEKFCILVLLYGFFILSWDWWVFWVELVLEYYFIVFDFLGFGYLDKFIDYDYEILEQVDLVEVLLDFIGVI